MLLFLKPLKAEIQLLSADQIAENSHAVYEQSFDVLMTSDLNCP